MTLNRHQQALVRAAQQLHAAFGLDAATVPVYADMVLTHQATTKSTTGADIADGAPTETTFTGVLLPLGNSPQEQAIQERLGTRNGYIIVAPLTLAVSSADTIAYDGRTFEVDAPIVGTVSIEQRIVVVEVL